MSNFSYYLNKRSEEPNGYNSNHSNYGKGDSEDNYEEVEMVLSDLKKLNDLSFKVYNMIKKGDCDLEDWLQIKISEAADRIGTAYDYLAYKE